MSLESCDVDRCADLKVWRRSLRQAGFYVILGCCCDAAAVADFLLSRRFTAAFVFSLALVSLCTMCLDYQCTFQIIDVESYSESCPKEHWARIGTDTCRILVDRGLVGRETRKVQPPCARQRALTDTLVGHTTREGSLFRLSTGEVSFQDSCAWSAIAQTQLPTKSAIGACKIRRDSQSGLKGNREVLLEWVRSRW